MGKQPDDDDTLKDVAVRAGWGLHVAHTPNNVSLQNSKKVLLAMAVARLKPTRIVASEQGGIGIQFEKNDRFATIDCLNDGSVLVLMRNMELRRVWLVDMRQVEESVQAVQSFVYDAVVRPASEKPEDPEK